MRQITFTPSGASGDYISVSLLVCFVDWFITALSKCVPFCFLRIWIVSIVFLFESLFLVCFEIAILLL